MESAKDLLNEDDCKTILKNCLKRDDVTFESYKIEEFSETKEGLVGEHFLVRIQYDGNHIKSFFMKILNGSSQVLFNLAKALFAYEKEEFFYMKLLKEYERYGIETKFPPECYFCKPYLIVLENLIDAGYRSTPKTRALDLKHCKVCLKTLAKFHAAGMIYERLKGGDFNLFEEYSKYLKDMLFADGNGGDNPGARWLQCSLEGIFEVIERLDVDKDVFKERLNEALKELCAQEQYSSEIVNTILHGDLWSNNFLFAYKNGEPSSCKLIDYQILKYGPPSVDVVQFLFTNTRKAFRDEHFDELLDYYYEQLCIEFKSKDLESQLTKDEFLCVCEKVKLPTKLQTLADRSITFLSDETYADALSSDDKLEKFLFDDRSKHIVNSFENNEKFRDLITEDILELKSILFTNEQHC